VQARQVSVRFRLKRVSLWVLARQVSVRFRLKQVSLWAQARQALTQAEPFFVLGVFFGSGTLLSLVASVAFVSWGVLGTLPPISFLCVALRKSSTRRRLLLL